jgi:hypothetical protein
VVLEVWILGDPTDGPDGRHFVLGLPACWGEDPLNLNLLARGNIRKNVIFIAFSDSS